MRVNVTQRDDVLFEVTLPTPLSNLEPINLIMEYVDLDNRVRHENITTVAYNVISSTMQRSSFLHLEPSYRVPFDRFRVSVRLMSSFVIGPSVQDGIDHG